SETRSDIAVRLIHLLQLGIHESDSRRIAPVGTVEYIGELHPDAQGLLALGADFERAADIQVFHWAALAAVIAIVRGGAAELPRWRIHPRILVQDERLVWIVAVAVEVNCE